MEAALGKHDPNRKWKKGSAGVVHGDEVLLRYRRCLRRGDLSIGLLIGEVYNAPAGTAVKYLTLATCSNVP